MKKHMYVKDKYRTNSLSLIPGGHDVTVTFVDGFSQTYDKVKSPKAFISKISEGKRKIASITVDGQIFDQHY